MDAILDLRFILLLNFLKSICVQANVPLLLTAPILRMTQTPETTPTYWMWMWYSGQI